MSMSPIAKISIGIIITGAALSYMFPYVIFQNYYKFDFYFIDKKISDQLNVATSGGHEITIAINATNTKDALVALNSLSSDSCNGGGWANIKITEQKSGIETPMRSITVTASTTGAKAYRLICVTNLIKGKYNITSDISNALGLKE
jgi:hypothetical protein